MSVTPYKPTTPARRGMTSTDLSQVTEKNPVKSLTSVKKSRAGRNNQGRITVRHRGGGAKKHYRNVNFSLAPGTVCKIEAIEYDPNRSARIARLKENTGQYHYVLAAKGMKVGQTITVGVDASIDTGNRLQLKDIPEGTVIYDVELTPGRGGQLVRSAGTGAQLMAVDESRAQLRMPSGEVRIVNSKCMATIGTVGNEQHQNVKIGSAGRKRRMGWRPQVRGKVMNAVDHPHGGGDGGAHGIGRDPKTPWGKKTLGYRTRRRKSTDKNIVRTRHEAKRR